MDILCSFSFQVGNPLLDWNMNFKGRTDYFWSHGLMSDEVFTNITRHCEFDDSDNNNVVCIGAYDAFDPGQIDPYNIYAPICVDAANGAYYPSGYVRFIIFRCNEILKFDSAKIIVLVKSLTFPTHYSYQGMIHASIITPTPTSMTQQCRMLFTLE